MAERTAVNREVVGSSPTGAALFIGKSPNGMAPLFESGQMQVRVLLSQFCPHRQSNKLLYPTG